MSSVNGLVGPNVVGALATPSNARLGRELFGSGEVEVISSDASHMEFRVGGKATGRRRVELMSSKDGLAWKCSCTKDPELFCKHLVAAALTAMPGVEVLNDVVYTQVCVSFGSDERTRDITARLLAAGVTWMSGSHWAGRAILRISVSNWSTVADDVNTSLAAIQRAMTATGTT